jgi:sec-independent protein translocase protein TatB
MLNIGGGELLIILLVALIFLGPQRLPEVARQVGQTVNTLRGLARGFQAELEAAARPDALTANQNPDPDRDLREWAGDPDEPDEDSDDAASDDEPEFSSDPSDLAAKARKVRHDGPVTPVNDGGPLDLSDDAVAHAEAATAASTDEEE